MVISFFRHIDSHHKLIRWRLVIHRCIDGYSRLIIYLHSCNNNKAKTAKAQFLRSVSTFFWPRRSDHGMENIEVVREVLKKFGTSGFQFITRELNGCGKCVTLCLASLHRFVLFRGSWWGLRSIKRGSSSSFASSFYWKNLHGSAWFHSVLE